MTKKIRNFDSGEIVKTAVMVMEESGPELFSLRKVAARLGCDPMTVLYHFKSKENLLRAMADSLTVRLRQPDRDEKWDSRLNDLARQYRRLAAAYPGTFSLMLKFPNTGEADYPNIETVLEAFHDAGLPENELVSAGLGWYAAVFGLLAAETGGLIRQADVGFKEDVSELPKGFFPFLERLQPFYAQTDAETIFDDTLHRLYDGIRYRTGSGS